jgi:hypothetical protein
MNRSDSEADEAYFWGAIKNNTGKNSLFTVLIGDCKDGLQVILDHRLCRFYDELAFFRRRRRIYFF